MLELKKILFARDFSACAEHALPYALTLARRLHAELYVAFAEVLHGELPEPDPGGREQQLKARLMRVEGHDPDPTHDVAALHIEPVVVRGVTAAPAILDYAREAAVDLIVMGTHGRRGVRHLLLGSVAEEVVRLARCPVLTIVRQDPATHGLADIQSILVPIDFSRYAAEALRYAKELAALFGARLILFHAVDVHYRPIFFDTGLFALYDAAPDAAVKAQARLKQFYQEAAGPTGPFVQTEAVVGPAAHEIVKYAEEHAVSLIVMATHGLTGLQHFLMGSVAEKVVRTAPCPVLTVKRMGTVHEEVVAAQEVAGS